MSRKFEPTTTKINKHTHARTYTQQVCNKEKKVPNFPDKHIQSLQVFPTNLENIDDC